MGAWPGHMGNTIEGCLGLVGCGGQLTTHACMHVRVAWPFHGTFMVFSWKLHHPQCTPTHIKRPVAPICPFTIFTPNMEVHFEFSGEQEWLGLCLREEEMYFLRAGVWERETEFEVLFAAEGMIGKPSTWPLYLTKL